MLTCSVKHQTFIITLFPYLRGETKINSALIYAGCTTRTYDKSPRTMNLYSKQELYTQNIISRTIQSNKLRSNYPDNIFNQKNWFMLPFHTNTNLSLVFIKFSSFFHTQKTEIKQINQPWRFCTKRNSDWDMNGSHYKSRYNRKIAYSGSQKYVTFILFIQSIQRKKLLRTFQQAICRLLITTN